MLAHVDLTQLFLRVRNVIHNHCFSYEAISCIYRDALDRALMPIDASVRHPMASPTLPGENVAGGTSPEPMCVAIEQDALLDEFHGHSRGQGPSSGPCPERVQTMMVVNAASVLEKTDEQLLPSVYKYVTCSFHAGPGG